MYISIVLSLLYKIWTNCRRTSTTKTITKPLNLTTIVMHTGLFWQGQMTSVNRISTLRVDMVCHRRFFVKKVLLTFSTDQKNEKILSELEMLKSELKTLSAEHQSLTDKPVWLYHSLGLDIKLRYL